MKKCINIILFLLLFVQQGFAQQSFKLRLAHEKWVKKQAIGNTVIEPFMGAKDFVDSQGPDGIPVDIPPSKRIKLDLLKNSPEKETIVFLNGCKSFVGGYSHLFVFSSEGKLLFHDQQDLFWDVISINIKGKKFILVPFVTIGLSARDQYHLYILGESNGEIQKIKISSTLNTSLGCGDLRCDEFIARRLNFSEYAANHLNCNKPIENDEIDIIGNGYLCLGNIQFASKWSIDTSKNSGLDFSIVAHESTMAIDPEDDKADLHEIRTETYFMYFKYSNEKNMFYGKSKAIISNKM